MSLVEHLDQDNWQQMLDGSVAVVLEVLAKDRFRMIGSSADDVRGWLTSGGVSGVRKGLSEQMEGRRIALERRAEVFARWDALRGEHRIALLSLAAQGIIPANPLDVIGFVGWKPEDLGTMLARMRAGDRPFETAMRELGRSDADIAVVYASIDRALAEQGFPVGPPWKPS